MVNSMNHIFEYCDIDSIIFGKKTMGRLMDYAYMFRCCKINKVDMSDMEVYLNDFASDRVSVDSAVIDDQLARMTYSGMFYNCNIKEFRVKPNSVFSGILDEIIDMDYGDIDSVGVISKLVGFPRVVSMDNGEVKTRY